MHLSRNSFLQGLPEVVRPQLPPPLQKFQARRPWSYLLQLHYGEPALHYEVSPAAGRPGWELGLHFEARDHDLNRFLLLGFRRHLFEIKDVLGERIEAEMWDRGWTKVYEVYPDQELTAAYQVQVGGRLAQMMACLHPIFVTLRAAVPEAFR